MSNSPFTLRLTDDQFIARQRRLRRTCRWRGGILLAIGVIIIGLSLWLHTSLRRHALEDADELSMIERAIGQPLEQRPTDFAFAMGMAWGFIAACGIMSGAGMFVSGLVVVFGPDRKTRLLIQCWDRLESRADAS